MRIVGKACASLVQAALIRERIAPSKELVHGTCVRFRDIAS